MYDYNRPSKIKTAAQPEYINLKFSIQAVPDLDIDSALLQKLKDGIIDALTVAVKSNKLKGDRLKLAQAMINAWA